MIEFFDSHAHLADECRGEESAAIVEEAVAAGVTGMLFAGTSPKDCPQYLEFAAAHPQHVHVSMGIHPEAALTATPETLEQLRRWLKAPGVVALGEVGLDNHWGDVPPALQEELLVAQLKIAAQLDMPVIIHCREAFPRCFQLVQEHLPAGHPLQIHSFADGPQELEQWLTLNTVFSYNGMVTFNKAENIRETLRLIPLERLMLETDSPYLTPVPYRGRPNAPKHIPLIAARVAQELGKSVGEIGEITTRNARRFFRLPQLD